MHKTKNFIYVANIQNGACLLFDRKGLGYRQVPLFKSNQWIENSLHLFGVLQKRVNIQGVLGRAA